MTGYPLWLSKTNINDDPSGTNANPVVEVTTYTNVPSGTSGVAVWERRVRDGRGLTVVTDEDVMWRVVIRMPMRRLNTLNGNGAELTNGVPLRG